jgi:hypothetical protein
MKKIQWGRIQPIVDETPGKVGKGAGNLFVHAKKSASGESVGGLKLASNFDPCTKKLMLTIEHAFIMCKSSSF